MTTSERTIQLSHLSTLWECEIQIVRRLNILLPEKAQLHSHRATRLFIYFFHEKIKKESSLNNLTTSSLSVSSSPAREKGDTRKIERAPRVTLLLGGDFLWFSVVIGTFAKLFSPSPYMAYITRPEFRQHWLETLINGLAPQYLNSLFSPFVMKSPVIPSGNPRAS